MNHHASMNRIYRLVWSELRSAWVPVAETARGRGKSGRSKSVSRRGVAGAGLALALAPLAYAAPPAVPVCVASTCAVSATSHPLGGQVVSGAGRISQSGNSTDIVQSSQDLVLDWLSFNVGSQETVNFLQPSTNAIAVNRISGSNGSQILGHINANGDVWLINPNGVAFGEGAEVNVGGLVASTLNDLNRDSNTASFSGTGGGSIENQGMISAANSGYVALLANHVGNQGTITARLGTVALGAGTAATLTFSGNSLVKMQVDQSTLKTLAENGGVIQADGGTVIMSAGTKNALLASVVNNTGVIEARTAENHDGSIELLGGMTAGTVNVGGTLDASAPNGGNGGFIETNAAHVAVENDARVTTAAAMGLFGTWLIDPTDFTVAPSGGDITGATLSTDLNATNFTILSSSGTSPVTGGGGGGNINVNDTVSWSGKTVLTLTAANNVNVNSSITASGANARLIIKPNTKNGSETASGTGTLNLGAGASITLSGASAVLSIATSSYTLGTGATINLPDVAPTSTSALVIGGTSYTVLNSLGAPGSTSGTDLEGINGNLSGHYALGSNVDATPTGSWNSGAGFTPIGNSTTPFTGIFDGLGHAISNLMINLPSGRYVGLFGYTGTSSVVQNVGLLGGSVTGSRNVGGLVGLNYGAVSNSYMSGSVSAMSSGFEDNVVGGLVGSNAGTITNSYATGSVSGADDDVGGLVGYNHGTISNSSATGSVTGAENVGGLVGYNYGTVSNSHATGNVTGIDTVGGLAGFNYATSTVTNSYATGAVTGTQCCLGGLVGQNYGTISNSYATGSVTATGGYEDYGGLVGLNYGSISNSYATGKVTASFVVGGLVGANVSPGTVVGSFWNTTTSGQSTSAGGTGLTTAQMQTAANFAGFVFTATPGASGNNWVMVDTDGTLNNSGSAAGAAFPMLASEYSTTIGNAHQLQLMAMNLSGSYVLGQNVDASTTGDGTDVWGSTGFTPIGNSGTPFTGAFNGLAHTINGLTINRPLVSLIGLFGDTGSTAVVQNVGLTGVSVSGYEVVGALVGSNYGALSNSYATGNVTANLSNVGGLVGRNAGAVNNSYATDSVNGFQIVGGLAGSNYGSVTSSYATGQVSGSRLDIGGLVGANYGSVSKSYAAGGVSGASGVTAIGGLAGINAGGTISGSFWDVMTSGQSSSAGGIGMTTAQMQTKANFTSATSANGNVNPGWNFTNTWVTYNGFTYPLLRFFMTPLAVTANNATRTYSGSAFSGGNGVSYSITPNANLLGTVSYGGTSQGAVNVGGYVITPSGLYSNQQGYIISYGSGSLTISQLASVAWVGGATGNWSTASNWAGGAIPDLANVAAVTIPKSTTVTYDAGVAGTTVLTTLTDAGKLVVAAGNLSTTGNLSAAGYQQSGGIVDVGGTLSITSKSGAVTLGNIDAAALSVSSTKGAITQLAATTLDVTGTTTLTADNGVSGAGDVKYNILLAQAADSFGSTVSANGLTIDLLDTSTGGLMLGNTTATGTLTATSRGGAIAQATSTAIDVTGAASLTANNGLGGSSAVKYNITLAQPLDSFGGAIASNGLNIDLLDSSTSGLTLGNTTATGNLTLTSLAGAITQGAAKTVKVTGTTSMSADNEVSGAGDVKYNITLANANNFGGAVSANGLNVDLADNTSGVILGNTTATGALTVDSSGGAITQTTGTALNVTGTTSITADNGGSTAYGITLAQATNRFGGAVTADGGAITLEDATVLTANVDSSGAVSLTAAGALNVSGTVGTALTTKTAGTNHATTFGATTVGTSLSVKSTGAVTETSSNILKVAGRGTTTVSNPNVTVNGVTGAEIPVTP